MMQLKDFEKTKNIRDFDYKLLSDLLEDIKEL